MARLDLDRDCVVVRIVYDGTARSGKTTTLRSLGVSLGREVETPAETEGRTLYFDWLDYTGGRFDQRMALGIAANLCAAYFEGSSVCLGRVVVLITSF